MIPTSFVCLPFLVLILLLPFKRAAAVTGALLCFMDAGFLHTAMPVGIAWAAALTFCGRIILQFDPAQLRQSAMRPEALILWGVVAADLAVLILSLTLFAGHVQVQVGRAMFSSSTVPLGLFPQHLNQLAYAVACPILAVCTAAAVKQGALTPAGLENPGRLIVIILCAYLPTVVFLCLWQQIHFATGLFYWEELLHSDQSAKAWNQMLGSINRVTGPFPEPSNLGYHISGVASFFLALGILRNPRYLIMAGLALYLLVVSTSTTAFGGIAICVVVTAGVCALRFGWLSPLYGRPATANLATLLSLGVVAIGVVVLLSVIAGPDTYLSQVLNRAVFAKTESRSFDLRTMADQIGGDIFLQTYGIGVGLGGHIANSGVVTMLSNLGFAGVIMIGSVVWICGRSTLRAVAAGASAADPLLRKSQQSTLEIMIASAALLLSLAFLHALTAPLFTSPILWVAFGSWMGLNELSLAFRTAPRLHPAPIVAGPVPAEA